MNASEPAAKTKTLTLTKGAEHFRFTYEVGCERQMLDHLVDLVHQPQLNFDWFDCAVLSHQLGMQLAEDLRRYIPADL